MFTNVLAVFLALNAFIQALIVLSLLALVYLVLVDPAATSVRVAGVIGLAGMFAAGHTAPPKQ